MYLMRAQCSNTQVKQQCTVLVANSHNLIIKTYQLHAWNFHEWYQLHCTAVRQFFDKISKQILVCPKLVKFLHKYEHHLK